MNKSFGAALAVIISSIAPAIAADLPAKVYTKAPPVMPFSWTGFYVGANAGCGWNNTTVNSPVNNIDPADPSFFSFATERQGGCFGGVQGGYNYQFAPNWVMGFEVDGQFGRETSRGQLLEVEDAGVTTEVLANYEQRMQHYGTARGRIGYASNMPVVGQTLLYVTGGFAWARNKMEVDVTAGNTPAGPAAAFIDTKTLTGYAVGGGVEFAVDRHWSWKAEYLFLNFGNNTYNTFVSDDGTPFSAVSATTRMHTGRIGLNYKLY
jgi:outer membrane immunogenic protein